MTHTGTSPGIGIKEGRTKALSISLKRGNFFRQVELDEVTR